MPLAQVLSDSQVERAALASEKSADRLSSAIESVGYAIAGAVACGLALRMSSGNGAAVKKVLDQAQARPWIPGIAIVTVGVGSTWIYTRQPPPRPLSPEEHERRLARALIAKPKSDTVRHAQELINSNSEMPKGLAAKWQLNAAKDKAIAFSIRAAKPDANKAFKNELAQSGLPESIVERLSKTDFVLAPDQTKHYDDFCIDGGTGEYYWYSLRSTSAVDRESKKETVSIALMLCFSMFKTSQMVERVETITTVVPVFENRPTSVLKKKGGIIFGEREYDVVIEQVQVGERTEVTQRPIFKDHVFTPEEVNAVKSHMCRLAATKAKLTLEIEE